MYELIILSHLMRRPMHGYGMAKIMDDINGPFARVSHGRFYPLLAKLEAAGLIVAIHDAPDAPRNNRRQRTFAITPAGKGRFHTLMLDTTSNPGEYARFFWAKLPFLEHLAPEERLHLLDHYLNYCQTLIFHLKKEAEEMERDRAFEQYMSGPQREATLHVIRHHLAQWQLDYDHIAAWRERSAASSQSSAVSEMQ